MIILFLFNYISSLYIASNIIKNYDCNSISNFHKKKQVLHMYRLVWKNITAITHAEISVYKFIASIVI